MIVKQMHDLRWEAPRQCRITKWRVNHVQANDLAHDLVRNYHGLRGCSSPADIVGMVKDGTFKMWGIPVTLKA